MNNIKKNLQITIIIIIAIFIVNSISYFVWAKDRSYNYLGDRIVHIINGLPNDLKANFNKKFIIQNKNIKSADSKYKNKKYHSFYSMPEVEQKYFSNIINEKFKPDAIIVESIDTRTTNYSKKNPSLLFYLKIDSPFFLISDIWIHAGLETRTYTTKAIWVLYKWFVIDEYLSGSA